LGFTGSGSLQLDLIGDFDSEASITYTAAPGETVYLKGSEELNWTALPDGTHRAELPKALFDALGGKPNGTLHNPC